MSFLAPLFFAGLAALTIPVLIHLIQRERKNVVPFPSLMFVRRIPYSSIRRRRIHNWALLMLRLAALALIVIAFARPFVRGATLAAAAGGARDIVVLLDRSYSMGHGDQWTRAKRAASDAIAGMANGDRATLVTFATTAEVSVQPTDERARLQSEIEATTLSASGTRFGPALKLAGSLLAASNFPRREVIVVSDFQRAGWTPGDGLRLPAGTMMTPITVSATDTRNVAVTPVSLQRESASGQDRVTVTGSVLNRSGEAIRDLPVSLEVDGHVAETSSVTLEPHAAGTVAFKPVILTSPNTRGVVRIGDDALAPDNAFHFVLSPPRPVPLTIVSGGSRGGQNQALYLARALAIGESPKFDIATRPLDDLSDDVLGRTRILVINDASPAEPLSQRLRRFVEGGGGLLIVLGPQSAWPQAAAEYLPALPGGNIDRTRGPAGALGTLEYGHTVFEPFRAPRSGDFSAARFYGYRAVTPAKDAEVLARFDDGAPALLGRTVGRGRVLVWTSTLDLFWSDLPLKPVYLPFVHQMARHLADYRQRATWSTVGQVIDLSQEGDATRPRVALSPTGTRLTLEGEQGRVLELAEQGFYEIRERDRGAALVTVAAANVELAESDPTSVDPTEIVAAVAGTGHTGGSAEAPATVPDETHEKTQRIWWYLLFAGILLLTGESLLAHRLSRANA
jgi:hypothetical protein